MMPTRPIQIPDDLASVQKIALESFQYPENPAWSVQEDEREKLSAQIESIRRLWPLLRAIALIYPKIRNLILGYLWEEEGKPVGTVILSPSNLVGGPTWIIGTVAVLPAYRRRGIARRLALAGIERVKEKGARTALLSVISENTPAYELYRSLGFVHFATRAEMTRELDLPSPEAHPLPPGYRTVALKRGEWRPRYELARRITPEAVQKFRPVEQSQFHAPLPVRTLLRLYEAFSGNKESYYAVGWVPEGGAPNGEIVAVAQCTLRTKAGGFNQIRIELDPAHPDLGPYLVSMLVREAMERSPGRRIEFDHPTWENASIEAALETGFTRRNDWDSMGLRLE